MGHDCRVTSPDVQPTGRPNARMRQTVGDMARSMAVVLVVVAVIMLLAWRPDPEPVKVVDVAPAIALAVAQAPFTVSAPTGLPAGWRPTSARWERTADSGEERVLHLGYVTPGDEYAQVTQSAAHTAAYLDEQTAGGEPAGQLPVGDVVWEQRATQDRRSLVVAGDDAPVTVVSGSADWDELTELAASLEPVEVNAS
jgi:hypothetical protein